MKPFALLLLLAISAASAHSQAVPRPDTPTPAAPPSSPAPKAQPVPNPSPVPSNPLATDPFKKDQAKSAESTAPPPADENLSLDALFATGEIHPLEGSADENLSLDALFVFEVFTLPKMDGFQMLSEGLNDSDLHARVLKANGEKKAVQENLVMIRTRGGQRAKVEQIDEFPYPTNLDPPQMPQTLQLGPTTASPQAGTEAPAGASSASPQSAPPAPLNAANSGLGIITTVTPTTFEIRNLGESLEVDPVFREDGRTIDVNLAPAVIRLLGTKEYNGLPHPIFQTRDLTTSFSVSIGRPAFLGTLTAHCKSGVPHETTSDSISLAFLTAFRDQLPKTVTPPVQRDIQSRFELISVEKSVAHSLIADRQNDGHLRESLAGLIKQNQAKLEIVLAQRLSSGQRSKVDQVDEYAYPTEFDPPSVSQTLTITDPTLLRDLRSGHQSETGLPPKSPSGGATGGVVLITAATATQFQTRNLGSTMEIDPVVGEDGITIDANVAPEVVRLASVIKYNGLEQPIFETQKMTTAVQATLGIPCLLGTMSPPVNTGAEGGNKEDRVWLAFLTFTGQ